MFEIPPPLAEHVSEAETAVGLHVNGLARNLGVWRDLGIPDEVAVYTIPDEYIQMTNARGWLAVVGRWAATNHKSELSRWLIETVDQLDDSYFAVTVPDSDHHSWAVSGYYDSWARRLSRNDFLAQAFRMQSPVMTASREHRVVCSGGETDLDIQSQYSALDATNADTDSLRELVAGWAHATTQASLDTQAHTEAVAVRNGIATYLAAADQHGYVDVVNEVVNTLDHHDDRFRSHTSPIANVTDEEAPVHLAHWWTRRARPSAAADSRSSTIHIHDG